MAHTQNAVVVTEDGIVHMIVIPDDDSQLSDPAFNPAGHTHLRVPHNPAADPVAAAADLHPAMNVRMPSPAALAQSPDAHPAVSISPGNATAA